MTITIEELERNPTLISNLDTIDKISNWLLLYKSKQSTSTGIRVGPWRVKVKVQLDLVKSSLRYRLFEERIYQLYYLIISKYEQFKKRNIQVSSSEYWNFMTTVSRSIGNDIHDFPDIKTGIMTLDCYKSKLIGKKYNPTIEHFWPRSVISGRIMLIECFELGEHYSLSDMIKTLCKMCQTIGVLGYENRNFIAYQKLGQFVSPQVTIDNTQTALVLVTPPKKLILHKNWGILLRKYGILNPIPYQFNDVLSKTRAKNILRKDNVGIK